jgi:uncharacterized Ntn-hydrolase superfamily protein
MTFQHQDYHATYSIVARDPITGDLGIAVQTHQMCVGAAVPWLEPGVGAVATQAMTNVSFGPLGLDLLRNGYAADDTLKALIASDKEAAMRQVAVMDSMGKTAAWTGENCIAEANHALGIGYSVQANMMTNSTVIRAMANTFENASGDLALRMMAAMFAAQAEGGDIRGMQSAALKIVPGTPNEKGPKFRRASVDLRIDESNEPLEELNRLVRLRRGSLIDQRGHDLLEEKRIEEALTLWTEARELAPELEEMSFWQAVVLADNHDDIANASKILIPMLNNEARRDHWIDLIRRIQECGIIENEFVGEKLIAALMKSS